MQSIRVTLYDIFGYLAPGIVSLTALAIALWSIYFPAIPLSNALFKSRPVLFTALAFVAYMGGHLMQAIGNLHKPAEKRNRLHKECADLQSAVTTNLYDGLKQTVPCNSLSDVTALAFATLSQRGKTADYEVFVYREGFYRGGYISFILLALSFLLRGFHVTYVKLASGPIQMGRAIVFTLAVLCTVTAFFYYERFVRFGDYRVKYMLGVLLVGLQHQTDEDQDKE